MPIERITILFNPSAGMGRALVKKNEIEERLRGYGLAYDLAVTESEEQLRTLTREQARTGRILVGAGGDSTFHIMANEIMAADAAVTLGMIPVGSSNDVAREFGVSSLENACRALRNQKTKGIDIGYISEGEKPVRYFLGQANIGLGVFVNRYVAELARRKPGLAGHQALAGVMGVLGAYRNQLIPVHLAVESQAGRMEGEFTAAVISNVRYWATGKIINPNALPDDGRLDLCLIKKCSFLRLVRVSWLAGRGEPDRAKEVKILQSPSFRISSETPFAIQTDGEILGSLENPALFNRVALKIRPRALTIIYDEEPASSRIDN